MADSRIRTYRDAAVAMQQGQFDTVVPVLPADDIGQLGTALASLSDTLERRFAELNKLCRLTEKVGSGILLDEMLEHVYEAFRELIPYDRIGLALLDEQGLLKAHWARAEYDGIRLPKGFAARLEGSSLQEVLRSGRPRILNDLEAYLGDHPGSRSTRLVVEEGIRSSLTCPLLVMGKAVGFIFFSSRGRGTYRDAHVELFRQIAGQLAALVEKGRLYQRLVELDASRSALLGVVAHDLRSPIGVVLSMARLLRSGRFGACTGSQDELLGRMERNCDGMLHMVNDLLDVAAIEAGQVRLEPAAVDPGPLLAEAASGERMLAEAKKIRITLALEGVLPRVTMDARRVAQVISNLLSNAIKFSPAGSEVILRAALRGTDLVVSVTDRGQGIPAAELPRLFRPFGRTSVRPTAGENSTGLGLAICRRIAEAHHGTMGVESLVGAGSTFTLTLPVAGPTVPDADRSPGETASVRAP